VKDYGKIWQKTHSQKLSVRRVASAMMIEGEIDSVSNLMEAFKTNCNSGAEYGCVALPGGCLSKSVSKNAEACKVVLSWRKNGTKNSYKLFGKPNTESGYIAMGFSKDKEMVTRIIMTNFELYKVLFDLLTEREMIPWLDVIVIRKVKFLSRDITMGRTET